MIMQSHKIAEPAPKREYLAFPLWKKTAEHRILTYD